jgi:hypothetical protein
MTSGRSQVRMGQVLEDRSIDFFWLCGHGYWLYALLERLDSVGGEPIAGPGFLGGWELLRTVCRYRRPLRLIYLLFEFGL